MSHWGQGGLETGDYMLGTFRAHVHLSVRTTSAEGSSGEGLH